MVLGHHNINILRFYMENNMQVYDIKEFIQFIPGRCFKPFTEKVVQLRVEATHDGDDAKQLTAKLFGNSGTQFFLDDLIDLFSIW